MDFSGFKLIIWDLDETLWEGILSEGTARLSRRNIDLISNIVSSGVMCSICSKNDKDEVMRFLEQHHIAEDFVFSSINWSPKGARVKQIIDEMGLRNVNVLFIDDNPLNREEVLHFCEGISAAGPEIIDEMVIYFGDRREKDIPLKRLKQYQLLEKKKQYRALSGSNEAFLAESKITVEIKHDCIEQFSRIAELVQRTNQLNFTKLRSSENDLREMLADKEISSGYVTVKDRFGDYGIVGFYAVKNNTCLHFLFSCRTLNMGIEQYVYYQLGSPAIEIVGEVASKLTEPYPYWINGSKHEKSGANDRKIDIGGTGKVLFKGPCDMQQLFSFINESDQTVTEFAYINQEGILIEGSNHSVQILESAELPPKLLEETVRTLPFGDKDMFTTCFFDPQVSHIVFSLFTDPHLGLYRNKETGVRVAFGEYTNDLTDENRWKLYIDKKVYTANFRFTNDNLKYIKDHYKFEGRLSPEQVLGNMERIYAKLSPSTVLILVLGSETPFEGEKQEVNADKHIYNTKLNALIRKWAEGKSNVHLIDVNKIIKGQGDFTNTITHFKKRVYFEMSQMVIQIINGSSKQSLSGKSTFKWARDLLYNGMLKRIKRLIDRMRYSD